MYAGVPTAAPTVRSGSPSSNRARAMPKWVVATRPSRASSTLSGLNPGAPRRPRAPRRDPVHDRERDAQRLVRGTGPRAILPPSGSPSTSSIVRKRSPSCSPMSNTRATLRCVTRLASFTSRRNHSHDPGDLEQIAPQHLEGDDLLELRCRARGRPFPSRRCRAGRRPRTARRWCAPASLRPPRHPSLRSVSTVLQRPERPVRKLPQVGRRCSRQASEVRPRGNGTPTGLVRGSRRL